MHPRLTEVAEQVERQRDAPLATVTLVHQWILFIGRHESRHAAPAGGDRARIAAALMDGGSACA